MTPKTNPPRYQTGRIFLSVLRLDPLPACAALGVDDLDALGFQLIPDAVRFREVLRLLRLVPRQHQCIDGRVPLAGDGVAALGLGGLGLGGLRPLGRR